MSMDRGAAQAAAAAAEAKSPVVLSIECLKGTSKGDEWTADMLQTGDIVEELRIGNSMSIKSPFKNGRSKIQKILHTSYKNKETSIFVRVRRGADDFAELQACIVPNDSGGRRQYMLRSIADPNYAVGFLDRTEAECFLLQDSRNSRMVNALSSYQLHDGYVSYSWERKMQTFLSVPGSSGFLSILFIPKASDKVASRYNDLDDTLARAHTWLNASQALGVPIVFMNIQTESMLTKISGETASSTVNAGSLSDLSNLANASLYGFEDYHGVDIGVVRAVRLWYAPLGTEYPVEIRLEEGDSKLGFAISRTAEGFIYISTVIDDDENAPSTRSGLLDLYREARSASKLLVISRVSNQKVLPWMVSSTGAVRCFDTVSLSQKLSLHRHAKVPILIHLMLCDLPLQQAPPLQTRAAPPHLAMPSLPEMPLPPEVQLACRPNDNQVQPLPAELPFDSETESDGGEFKLRRDTAGERSFSFHDFPLPNNWV